MRFRVLFVGPLTPDLREDLSTAGVTLLSHESHSSVFPTGPFPGPDHHVVLIEARTPVEAARRVREVVDQRGAYTVFDNAEPA